MVEAGAGRTAGGPEAGQARLGHLLTVVSQAADVCGD